MPAKTSKAHSQPKPRKPQQVASKAALTKIVQLKAQPARAEQEKVTMMKKTDDLSKLAHDSMDLASKGFGEWNKGWQQIANEMTNYTKRSFEEGSATFEKLSTARSLDQVIAIQTDYAKRSYEDYIAQMSKLSSLYVDMARDAYRPMEKMLGR